MSLTGHEDRGSKRKKILYYSEGWGVGGIERFIMNTVTALDPEQYGFDIFCTHDWSRQFDRQIREHGGHRYVVFEGEKPDLVTRLRRSCQDWAKLLDRNHYDIVHINTMNGMGFAYAHIARKAGVPVRIVHSHNTSLSSGHTIAKRAAHDLGYRLFSDDATTNLACSEPAGAFLFRNKPFKVIHNGVDSATFRYDSEIRSATRKQLGVNDGTILFGSHGRLSEAKNPLFQVAVLQELKRQGRDACLLLIGDGELREKTLENLNSLGLQDSAIIRKSTSHPEIYLNALDIFTIPSKFEGFPTNSVVEATATGLPCLIPDSFRNEDTIPFTNFKYLPLDPQTWATTINTLTRIQKNRLDGTELIYRIGYDRGQIVRELEKLYHGE